MANQPSVRLPDFAGKRCEMLTVCGRFAATDSIPLDGFSEKRVREFAQYTKSRRKVRVRLIRDTPRNDIGAHVHVDFTHTKWQKYITDIVRPDDIENGLYIESAMSKLSGYQIDAEVIGYFAVTKDELPGAIRYVLTPAEAGGVQLEMTEGTYRVRGAPIHTIQWNTIEGSDVVQIIMVATNVATMTSDYFESSLADLEAVFSVLFLSGKNKE